MADAELSKPRRRHSLTHRSKAFGVSYEDCKETNPWPVVDPRPAPLLGEHTQQVLMEVLGYPAEQVHEVADAGVVE